MRYVIVGAGALGGAIGVKLAEAGHEVVLIARGPHLAALQCKGLRLRTPESDSTVKLPAFGSVLAVEPALGAADTVILCVKVHQAPPVLAQLAAATAMHALPAVVCCTNGLDAERQALRHFPRTYAMLPCMFATHLQPGEVELFGRSTPAPHRPAWLNVGCYPRGVDTLAEQLAGDLRSAGFRSEADAAVMDKKRAKMVTNLGNATAALRDADSEAGRRLMRAARAECLAAYRVAGLTAVEVGPLMKEWISLIGGQLTRQLSVPSVPGAPEYMGSSWQSLARASGDIECAFLNGEVCLLGRLHGLAVRRPLRLCVRPIAWDFPM
jgi:2-dehydropantoate 2-reductase